MRECSNPFKLPLIYPITDKALAAESSHLAIVRELVRGGATLIQIRDKETPLRELLLDLRRCAEHCRRHNVRLLINDRCDMALSCAASGIHLGQDDLPPEAARMLLGRRSIIGFSTHTLAQVRQAAKLPIQYLGFGPIYPTSTKRDASSAVGIVRLRQACRQSCLPVVAIGGIAVGTVPEVLQAGAASAAVISAVMCRGKVARAMSRLLLAAERAGHTSAGRQ